jgi:hypothetical protein
MHAIVKQSFSRSMNEHEIISLYDEASPEKWRIAIWTIELALIKAFVISMSR